MIWNCKTNQYKRRFSAVQLSMFLLKSVLQNLVSKSNFNKMLELDSKFSVVRYLKFLEIKIVYVG